MIEPVTRHTTPSVPVASGIEGYGVCRCGCGRHDLKHVLHLTKGLSWECFRDDVFASLRDAEIVHRNAVVKARVATSKPRKPRAPQQRTDTARLADLARKAAGKRLAQLQPELYAVLYADERRKRGLPIIPLRVPEGAFAATVATNAALADYSADVNPGEMDAHDHDQAGQRPGGTGRSASVLPQGTPP